MEGQTGNRNMLPRKRSQVIWRSLAPILQGGESAKLIGALMLMKTPEPVTQLYLLAQQSALPIEIVEQLGDDGRDNLEAYIANSADSTVATFRFDMVRWVAWAETNDVDMLAPRARDVRDYAKEVERGLKPASVKRMVSNVGVLTGKIAGNTNQTTSILVTAELKRQRREKGGGHKQAHPIRQKGDVLNIDDPAKSFSIENMIRVLEPDKSLWAARAKLLLSLGGDTGRRGGEYRLARMQDLMMMKEADGGGVFVVPRSKTDQDGVGMVKFASKRTMRFRDEYRAALKECGGDVSANAFLFAPVDRWSHPTTSRGGDGAPLTTGGLIKILRQIVRRTLPAIAAETGEEIDDLEEIIRGVSGHSFRVGLAMDLVTAGESMVAICVEGGWATPAMPVLYTRFISAGKGAAARMAARLGYG